MKRDEITPHNKHQLTQYGLFSLHQVLNNLFFLSLGFFFLIWAFSRVHWVCQGLFKYKLYPFLQYSGQQQSHPLCNHHTILLSPEAFFGEIILLFLQLSHLPGLTKDLSAVIHSAHAWQEPRCPNFPLSSYFLSLKIPQHMCEYLHSLHFSHHPSDVISLCVWSPSLLAPEGRAQSQQPKFS